MAPELKFLLFSAVLTFVQVLIAAASANQEVGLTTLAGNRDNLPSMIGFAGRAKRAHLNMLENMVVFTALVLVAVVANKTNSTTAMGAAIFFWARLVYALVYLIGVPWLRTVVWFVSVIGMAMVAKPLLF
jgi:uncharacterized MAPEG superfamily protein